jgi:ATP-dependent DNA helicase RecG
MPAVRAESQAFFRLEIPAPSISPSSKELGLTEGRCTGIPTIREAMAKNGSPPPKFSTDQGRTYFLVELPVRPRMDGIGQAHHEAHDEAHEELSATEVSVLRFVADHSRNRREIGEHLGIKSRSGHFYKVIDSLRNLGLIELTIPDKPQSKNQRMRITRQGRAWLGSQNQQQRTASEPKAATGDL